MLEVIKDYKKYIFFFIVIIMVICLSVFLFWKIQYKNHDEVKESVVSEVAIKEEQSKEESKEEPKEEIVDKKVFNVDIKGAVKKPGVYSLEEGSLVNDAIKMAGLKSSASTKNLNLSKKISDEMVIYVYTLKELTSKDVVAVEDCVSDSVEISNCDGASIIVTEEPKEETKEETKETTVDNDNNSLVNINKATKEQLMTLPGIGEAKALAIIKYREDNNNYKDITEIMNVSGIGEALYNKIKEFITI